MYQQTFYNSEPSDNHWVNVSEHHIGQIFSWLHHKQIIILWYCKVAPQSSMLSCNTLHLDHRYVLWLMFLFSVFSQIPLLKFCWRKKTSTRLKIPIILSLAFPLFFKTKDSVVMLSTIAIANMLWNVPSNLIMKIKPPTKTFSMQWQARVFIFRPDVCQKHKQNKNREKKTATIKTVSKAM